MTKTRKQHIADQAYRDGMAHVDDRQFSHNMTDAMWGLYYKHWNAGRSDSDKVYQEAYEAGKSPMAAVATLQFDFNGVRAL